MSNGFLGFISPKPIASSSPSASGNIIIPTSGIIEIAGLGFTPKIVILRVEQFQTSAGWTYSPYQAFYDGYLSNGAVVATRNSTDAYTNYNTANTTFTISPGKFIHTMEIIGSINNIYTSNKVYWLATG